MRSVYFFWRKSCSVDSIHILLILIMLSNRRYDCRVDMRRSRNRKVCALSASVVDGEMIFRIQVMNGYLLIGPVALHYKQNNKQSYFNLNYISKYILSKYPNMSSSTILNKSAHNIQSTQQALSILRNIREKRKKQNPTSIFQLVKSIYELAKTPNLLSLKSVGPQMISSQDYLGTNRESIEQMLVVIKNKILETNNQLKNNTLLTQHLQSQSANSKAVKSIIMPQSSLNPEENSKVTQSIRELQQSLNRKQAQIEKLKGSIKSSEHQSKNLQIKLLNNIKRLSLQIQEKDIQLKQLKQMLTEKQAEMDQLTKLNEKKHRRIRKLEEDVYDLQMQLEEKNEQLKEQKQCADFLQRKVAKILQNEAKMVKQQCSDDKMSVYTTKKTQYFYEDKTENIQSDMGIQTQQIECSPKDSEGTKHGIQQQNNSDNNSQCNSSTLTESKETKYIESIQRLTMELGQAYNKINELIKIEQFDSCRNDRTIQMVSCQDLNINKQDVDKSEQKKFTRKKGKSKSKSGYFSNFWN